LNIEKARRCAVVPEGAAAEALAPSTVCAAPQGIAARRLRRRARVIFARESALEIKSERGFDRKR